MDKIFDCSCVRGSDILGFLFQRRKKKYDIPINAGGDNDSNSEKNPLTELDLP